MGGGKSESSRQPRFTQSLLLMWRGVVPRSTMGVIPTVMATLLDQVEKAETADTPISDGGVYAHQIGRLIRTLVQATPAQPMASSVVEESTYVRFTKMARRKNKDTRASRKVRVAQVGDSELEMSTRATAEAKSRWLQRIPATSLISRTERSSVADGA